MKNINFEKYLDRLVGKIYKYLCIIEQNPEDAKKYFDSLTIEISGSTKYFEDDPYIISVLFSLQGIKDITDHNVCRKTVLECINNINRLKQKYNKKEE